MILGAAGMAFQRVQNAAAPVFKNVNERVSQATTGIVSASQVCLSRLFRFGLLRKQNSNAHPRLWIKFLTAARLTSSAHRRTSRRKCAWL